MHTLCFVFAVQLQAAVCALDALMRCARPNMLHATLSLDIMYLNVCFRVFRLGATGLELKVCTYRKLGKSVWPVSTSAAIHFGMRARVYVFLCM
jgi:hypothetical protein